MRDTIEIEQISLTYICPTMYSVYLSRRTRLTCRYRGNLFRVSENFLKQTSRAGSGLYLFVGDAPVFGSVSLQHVTPYVQCAGCRRSRGDSLVPPNSRQVRPMGNRQSRRPTGIPSPTWPIESIRSGSRSEAMAAGA
jgi:hypothetical protein